MGDSLFSIAEWIKDKKVYPFARILLNFVFCISITTFLFGKFYPQQALVLPIHSEDYWMWFIKGHFFIPVLLLVITWITTWAISYLIYNLSGWLVSRKFKSNIVSYCANRKDVDQGMAVIRIMSKKFGNQHLTKEQMTDFYVSIRKEIEPKDLEELITVLKEQEREIESNFIIVSRLVIAMIIYHSTLTYFSDWLFYTLLGISILIMFFLLLGSVLIEILPALAGKFDQTAKEYLANLLPYRPEEKRLN